MEKLAEIEQYVQNVKKEVHAFVGNENERRYSKLSADLNKYILYLDDFDCKGKEYARKKRKQIVVLIRETEQLLIERANNYSIRQDYEPKKNNKENEASASEVKQQPQIKKNVKKSPQNQKATEIMLQLWKTKDQVFKVEKDIEKCGSTEELDKYMNTLKDILLNLKGINIKDDKILEWMRKDVIEHVTICSGKVGKNRNEKPRDEIEPRHATKDFFKRLSTILNEILDEVRKSNTKEKQDCIKKEASKDVRNDNTVLCLNIGNESQLKDVNQALIQITEFENLISKLDAHVENFCPENSTFDSLNTKLNETLNKVKNYPSNGNAIIDDKKKELGTFLKNAKIVLKCKHEQHFSDCGIKLD